MTFDAAGVPVGVVEADPAALADTEATARLLDRSIDELYPLEVC